MNSILVIHNLPDNDALQSRMANVLDLAESEISLLKLKEGFTNQIPDNTTEIILAGGSDVRLHNNALLKDEVFKFIRECTLPLMGICFGAQLIARAYGAGIVRLPEPRAKVSTIRIVRDKQFFGNKYMQTVYSKHSWSLQNLPDDFIIYAVSASGVEVFRHKTKKIAGVQFHPELYTRACRGAKVFRQLRNIILTQEVKM